jgi:hypothetical protein
MEFLTVKFQEDRRVKISGRGGDWRTNVTLEIEAGTYRVSLDPSDDCTPPEQIITLQNTTVIRPMEISFEKASSSPGPA